MGFLLLRSLVVVTGTLLSPGLAQYPSETVAACPAPTLSSYQNTRLPDPFTFVNGSKVTTANSWACRREELRSLFQRYEIGPKPPKPTVTSSFSGNTLTINCATGGKSISFAVKINQASSGTAPFPGIIAFQFASIPIPNTVSTIVFNNDELASTTSATHGVGKFYDLYGKSHPAGGLAVWAWGVSRVINALEQQGSAVTKIDPSCIGVTGCSRNGKGAMVAGAFDDRVALTLPQEGGSGGAGCWRVAQAQKDAGVAVETAAQIVTGDAWFSPAFAQWTPAAILPQLPYDHHELYGLIVPRGMLVIENSDIAYLGDMSTFGCASAGRKLASAFGTTAYNAFGYTQVSHGDHCGVPASQQTDIAAYIDRYLLKKSSGSPIFKADKSYNFKLDDWANWAVPTIST